MDAPAREVDAPPAEPEDLARPEGAERADGVRDRERLAPLPEVEVDGPDVRELLDERRGDWIAEEGEATVVTACERFVRKQAAGAKDVFSLSYLALARDRISDAEDGSPLPAFGEGQGGKWGPLMNRMTPKEIILLERESSHLHERRASDDEWGRYYDEWDRTLREAGR